MAMGIDRQIQARMALGQDRLQQEYAQTQQLIDLLALQKLSKEKAEAARAVQASMQTNPATVKDQLEQQLMAKQTGYSFHDAGYSDAGAAYGPSPSTPSRRYPVSTRP